MGQPLSQVTIYGTVTDSLSGEPLAGVFVEAINEAKPNERASGFTDEAGNYQLNLVTDLKGSQEDNGLPSEFRLFQNYPNPFNPGTRIQFQLPHRSRVTLAIYNMLGQKVRTLLNRELDQDIYTVHWDGTNEAGNGVAAGIYLYQIRTPDYAETRKMVLLDGHVGSGTSPVAAPLMRGSLNTEPSSLLLTIRASSSRIVAYEEKHVSVLSSPMDFDLSVECLPFLYDLERVNVSEPGDDGYVYIGGLPGAVLKQTDSTETVVVSNLQKDMHVSTIVNPDSSFPLVRMRSGVGDQLGIFLYNDENPISVPGELIVPDSDPPIVMFSKPTNGDKDIILDMVIRVNFSEPLDTVSVNNHTFFLLDSAGIKVPGVIHFENNDATVLFDPVDLLTSNSTYTFFVTTEITDLQGLNMENRCEIVFSTGNNMSNGKIINVPGDVETIQGGIDFANPGDIVLVKPGTYYENINFKGKAITVASRFLVDGDTSYISYTIIDGSQPSHSDSGSVVSFHSGEDTTSKLCGFTIKGGTGTWISDQSHGGGIFCSNASPYLSNLIITENIAESCNGAGLCFWLNSHALVKNVVVKNNNGLGNASTIDGSGGISCAQSSSPILKDVAIYNNIGLMSGALYCNGGSNPTLINVTISNNFAIGSPSSSLVAQICSNASSIPVLINSIVWNNSIPEILIRDFGFIVLLNSDIQGGQDSILIWNNGAPYWLGGNIDVYPEFVDTLAGNFKLKANSPCIDSGIQDTTIYYNNGQDTLIIPPLNYVGTNPDMGAFEYGKSP
jgi:hypothetical protein